MKLILPLIFMLTLLICAGCFATQRSSPSCITAGWKLEVQWDSPLGMKSAPLPQKWKKDDTNYLQIVVRPPSATAAPHSAHLKFTGKNKTSIQRDVSLATPEKDGAIILSDFIQALGAKKNWPGTLQISIPGVCAQEMRVQTND